MDATERSRRAFQIFDDACELAPDERAAFVRDACGDDEALRREVDSLLEHDPQSGTGGDPVSELEAGAAVEALAAGLVAGERAQSAVPESVGPYRILREIGRGGMGVIYEAEQESPRRRIALKLIRPGDLSTEVVRRFRHEAQILGRLQHPGIAQIFEAGLTDEGESSRPFLAMELVAGEKLDRFAATHELDLPAKLELVARVCDAVQHAHQNGVIHRDLKPANILVVGGTQNEADPGATHRSSSTHDVDRVGQPKVLDFGIARIRSDDEADPTQITRAGQLIGTLAYMSPEQLDGRDVDTRSDVYALGVLLYVLVTGVPPHDVANLPLVEAARLITQTEPARPSSFDPSLRGDVEAILAHAMEKDRDKRYESAGALAADLRRTLRDEPILARPATATYHLRKFVRRHRVLVGGAALTLAALFVGATGTTLGFLSATAANQELERTNTLLESTNDDLADANRKLEDSNAALADANVDLETANDALDASLEEARIQAENARVVIDFLDEDLLSSVRPSGREGQGRDVTMYEVLEEASRRIEVATGPEGALAEKPLIESTIRLSIGGSYRALGELDAAARHLEQALAIRRELLGSEHLDTIRAEVELAFAEHDSGRFAEAAERLVVPTAILDANDDPSLSDLRWRALLVRGLALTSHDPRTGVDFMLELMKRAEHELDPDDDAIIAARNNMAAALAHLERFEEAEPHLKITYEWTLRTKGERDPATLAAMMSYAHVKSRMGRADEALSLLERAYPLHVEVLGEGHPYTIANAATLAFARSKTGRAEEGLELLEAAVEAGLVELRADHPSILTALHTQGDILMALGRAHEAIPVLEQVCRSLHEHAGPAQIGTWNAVAELADAYLSFGRFEEAERELGEIYDHVMRLSADNDVAFRVGLRRGKALLGLDRFDEAEGILVRAYESAARKYPGHPGLSQYAAPLHELYETWQNADPATDRTDSIETWRRRAQGR